MKAVGDNVVRLKLEVGEETCLFVGRTYVGLSM